MNSPLQISPKELLSRYQAGERNFAGIRLAPTDDDPEELCGADLSEIILSKYKYNINKYSFVILLCSRGVVQNLVD